MDSVLGTGGHIGNRMLADELGGDKKRQFSHATEFVKLGATDSVIHYNSFPAGVDSRRMTEAGVASSGPGGGTGLAGAGDPPAIGATGHPSRGLPPVAPFPLAVAVTEAMADVRELLRAERCLATLTCTTDAYRDGRAYADECALRVRLVAIGMGVLPDDLMKACVSRIEAEGRN